MLIIVSDSYKTIENHIFYWKYYFSLSYTSLKLVLSSLMWSQLLKCISIALILHIYNNTVMIILFQLYISCKLHKVLSRAGSANKNTYI